VTNRQELGRRIAGAAILRGTFTLRSGQTSSYYIDKYRLTTEPELLRDITDALARLMPPGTQRIAGTALGAVPLATALSLATGVPAVFVRVDAARDHGTSKFVEGALDTGDRALLVEDVVTTGGASLAAIERLRAAGADVVGVVAVVDRQGGGAEAIGATDVPFHALYTVAELGVGE
jgi:orotate phosphoribosyltransferase